LWASAAVDDVDEEEELAARTPLVVTKTTALDVGNGAAQKLLVASNGLGSGGMSV
jgi:hypothetical protein